MSRTTIKELEAHVSTLYDEQLKIVSTIDRLIVLLEAQNTKIKGLVDSMEPGYRPSSATDLQGYQ